MRLKNILLIIGALIFAILIAAVLQNFMNKKDKPVLKKTVSDTTLVLISPTELPPGSVIALDKLVWKEWPIKALSPHYITKSKTQELESLKGATVRFAILANEPIKLPNIIRLEGKSILSAIIKSGMRGVTVPYSKLANAPSFLAPGDIVDVVIPKRSKDNTDGYFGQTIIKGVQIIAIDHSLQNLEDNKQSTPKTITLEVTADQAEDLAASIRSGDIVISLRGAFGDEKGQPAALKMNEEVEDKKSRVVTMLRGKDKSQVTLKE